MLTKSLPVDAYSAQVAKTLEVRVEVLSNQPTTPNASSTRRAELTNNGLFGAAQKIEASFLAEMLKIAGVGKLPESFGGGAGEEQFSSFLREAQAHEMANAGGIGLAESLFQAMQARANG